MTSVPRGMRIMQRRDCAKEAVLFTVYTTPEKQESHVCKQRKVGWIISAKAALTKVHSSRAS
jgi:hypothetical protein